MSAGTPTTTRRARRSPRPRTVAGSVAGVVVIAVTLTACSDTDTSGAAFCSALRERRSVITSKVRDTTDIEALVTAYEDLDGRTPLAIAGPWTTLTDLVRTAATVAPDDAASVQAVADAAYAAERSAREVATWVATTCGFAMPAMQGLEGPVDPPASTKPGKKSKRTTTTLSDAGADPDTTTP